MHVTYLQKLVRKNEIVTLSQACELHIWQGENTFPVFRIPVLSEVKLKAFAVVALEALNCSLCFWFHQFPRAPKDLLFPHLSVLCLGSYVMCWTGRRSCSCVAVGLAFVICLGAPEQLHCFSFSVWKPVTFNSAAICFDCKHTEAGTESRKYAVYCQNCAVFPCSAWHCALPQYQKVKLKMAINILFVKNKEREREWKKHSCCLDRSNVFFQNRWMARREDSGYGLRRLLNCMTVVLGESPFKKLKEKKKSREWTERKGQWKAGRSQGDCWKELWFSLSLSESQTFLSCQRRN